MLVRLDAPGRGRLSLGGGVLLLPPSALRTSPRNPLLLLVPRDAATSGTRRELSPGYADDDRGETTRVWTESQ